MTHRIGRLVFGIFAVLVFFAGETFADTFEFLNFQAPAGWKREQKPDGVSYTRTTGVGLIYFYPSHAATGTAQDEFAKMWRASCRTDIAGARHRSRRSNATVNSQSRSARSKSMPKVH